MNYDKLEKLLRRLHQKTLKGEINWERTKKADVFKASFPNYYVTISNEEVDEDGTTDYYIKIYDQSGKVLEAAGYRQLSIAVGIESYDLLAQTYDGARRKALGMDKAIDDLLSELGG